MKEDVLIGNRCWESVLISRSRGQNQNRLREAQAQRVPTGSADTRIHATPEGCRERGIGDEQVFRREPGERERAPSPGPNGCEHHFAFELCSVPSHPFRNKGFRWGHADLTKWEAGWGMDVKPRHSGRHARTRTRRCLRCSHERRNEAQEAVHDAIRACRVRTAGDAAPRRGGNMSRWGRR